MAGDLIQKIDGVVLEDSRNTGQAVRLLKASGVALKLDILRTDSSVIVSAKYTPVSSPLKPPALLAQSSRPPPIPSDPSPSGTKDADELAAFPNQVLSAVSAPEVDPSGPDWENRKHGHETEANKREAESITLTMPETPSSTIPNELLSIKVIKQDAVDPTSRSSLNSTDTPADSSVPNMIKKYTSATPNDKAAVVAAISDKLSSLKTGGAMKEELTKFKVCDVCNEVISRGAYTEAQNKFFHEACFICHTCKKQLKGPFSVEDGNRICQVCVVSTAEPCARCGKTTITDDPMDALSIVWLGEKAYHPFCFTCSFCGVDLGASAFPSGDALYCKAHATPSGRARASPGKSSDTLGGTRFARLQNELDGAD